MRRTPKKARGKVKKADLGTGTGAGNARRPQRPASSGGRSMPGKPGRRKSY